MPRLICISGMNKGNEYELPGGSEISIGRSEKNSICVFDKKSSRFHCKIHVAPDGSLTLEDLESTNGLKVNDDFIKGRFAINLNDTISIGQTVFVVAEDSSDGKLDTESTGDEKYKNLLQQTGFQATKTTALRKMKTEETGKGTGFLSFFEVKEED